MTLKDKAQDFADRNNGNLLNYINGNLGPISAKIIIDDHYYYIFFAREWYHKYDGITIPQNILQNAVRDHAMIVIFINDREYWQHSYKWCQGKILHNTMFDKTEVLMKRMDLENPGIKFPIKPMKMEK